MKYKELLETGKKRLAAAGISDQDPDARFLLEYASERNGEVYYLFAEEEAPEKVVTRYQELLAKRETHIPLQHIFGDTEFMGLPFKVDERVLVPRPDTEILVEAALHFNKEEVKAEREKGNYDLLTDVLDLCTGSGCIAVSLAHYGMFKSVTASDISEDALELAAENAALNRENIVTVKSDMFSELKDRSFGMIVSNPPYIPSKDIEGLMPEVRDHDPRIALDGGNDGLDFYRIIAKEGHELLTEGGRLLVEIGCDQADSVAALLDDEGFTGIEIFQDFGGNDRVVTAVK